MRRRRKRLWITPKRHKIEVYVCGASRGNFGCGGYAFVIVDGATAKGKSGYDDFTTAYEMELVAACEALKYIDKTADADLFCCNQTIVNGITRWIYGWQKNGWKTSTGKKVKHRDLWEKLEALLAKGGRRVKWAYEGDDELHCNEKALNAVWRMAEKQLRRAEREMGIKLPIPQKIPTRNFSDLGDN